MFSVLFVAVKTFYLVTFIFGDDFYDKKLTRFVKLCAPATSSTKKLSYWYCNIVHVVFNLGC